jgi:hypothetical protein
VGTAGAVAVSVALAGLTVEVGVSVTTGGTLQPRSKNKSSKTGTLFIIVSSLFKNEINQPVTSYIMVSVFSNLCIVTDSRVAYN